jgi:hypothetical protein
MRAPLATLRLAKACNGFPSALAAVSSGFTTPSGRFLPQPPCHAIAVGDWGSRAERFFG